MDPEYNGNGMYGGGNGTQDGGAMRTSSEAVQHHAPAPSNMGADPATTKAVDEVLYSDIGVSTLLTRLKQSIASARDFAGFLKKRSSLEEDHAAGLKKLSRATQETIRRADARHGSYADQFSLITSVHERMADNGIQFALSLHQMHEDLTELTNNMERGRKHWKHTGLDAEGKVIDAERLVERAKAKYDSLAEEYDRVRTGDQGSGKKFGLKGPKSQAQQEGELSRKLQAADADYAAKVQSAQVQRKELLETGRPEAVRAIMMLIEECDSALTLQLQKFAAFNEKLLLGNGICVSPLKNPNEPVQPSLRDMVAKIDNQHDFNSFIVSHTHKIPTRSEAKYEQHPTLASRQGTTPQANRQSMHINLNQSQPPPSFNAQVPQQAPPPMQPNYTSYQPAFPQQPPQPTDYHSSLAQQQQQQQQQQGHSPQSLNFGGGPLQQMQQQQAYPPEKATYDSPPTKPVFGMRLDDLFKRDGTPVPMVVYQCIQAVDLYGLDVEGIYRVGGSQQHIQQMKAMFDSADGHTIDFRDPSSFHHDVNSVAGLLKQFFRDLPDPLFTSEHYAAFIDAARIDDDIVRRDSLHAIVNGLPDSNYATLRAVVLHLNRVQEHAERNRMSASNLAICFAPTLMGPHRGAMADAGLQARVVDTILVNTHQIFDED
ncbi:Rho GTPase-activating protein [Coniosporium tulheliwenetii]|uniref:Rho GTPase-activating protein n=1 Tax=Coniosporium tulheliwenetii TaxID=3383036 RepID=A0ACC2Z1K8_9PEZI|nr:Rho GTPase-activating protein [Cladosporium sp. JES 115]